ncbi:Transcriptional regulatory protein ZraR [Planctomycetes bacterium Poly30]|uniref:Transcriptional regulatory protein ZraR n=1 Tax=Saltatorellus ferox TaxID=2528018 RepID=A0A518EZH5_9BACT|nr:Transcriptional regulatory protein ZraR [Planctomycetes bacterium Poly30]
MSTDSSRDLVSRLPESIEVLRVLARRPDEVVLQARLEGELVAVRALADPEAGALAEWSALHDISSDAVASIRAWGPLEAVPAATRPLSRPVPGREDFRGKHGLWLARQWIDGESLEVFARTASDEQLASAAADIFLALDDVHAAGIVHGDLSPGNIIVGPDGRASLTDFGLSSSLQAGSNAPHGGMRRSGTPLFIAPEVLIGAAPSPESDHFGAAAVLALALAKVQVDPARFYGRFPAEPFLDAAEITLDALPTWSRDLLISLLARDPSERRSASGTPPWKVLLDGLGHRGPAAERSVVASVRPLSFLVGRHAWLDAVAESSPGLLLATSTDDQEADGVLDAAAIRWRCAGRAVHKVDLGRLTAQAQNTLDLDRRIASEVQYVAGTTSTGAKLSTAPPGMIVVSITKVDEWSLEALDVVAHAALAEGDVVVLLIVSEVRRPRIARANSPWASASLHAIPPLARADLFMEIGTRVAGGEHSDAAGLEDLVDRLDQLGQGSVARVNGLLRSAAEQGAFEFGATDGSTASVSLRETFVPAQLLSGRSTRSPRSHTDAERNLLAALILLGGTAPFHQALRTAGIPPDSRAPRQLLEKGLLSSPANGTLQVTNGAIGLEELGLEPNALRSLHRAALESLMSGPDEINAVASLPDQWVHALGAAAGPGDPLIHVVESAVASLERQGLRTRIARGLRTARAVLESEKRPLPTSLMGQLALSLARCSDGSEARRVAALSGDASVVQEVEGVLQHIAGDLEASAASFDRAGRPLQGLVQRGHASWEQGDLERLDTILEEAREALPSSEPGRDLAWMDMLGLAALAAERRGDTALAWTYLDQALSVADSADAPQSEAAIRINRFGLARRTGRLDAAHAELEQARALYQAIGSAAGEAQAQSLLGTLLKDQRRWLEAEQPLISALGRRERLGRLSAAATTRGTLGLMLLDRGHLRRAMDLLGKARVELEAVGLLGSHALTSAALDLARARVGLEGLVPPGSSDGDPRVADWHAQAAWLRGLGEAPPGLDVPSLEGEPAATPEGQVEALLKAASRFGEQGRDAHAARFAMEAAAIAATQGLDLLERRARQAANVRLTRVLQGLTEDEARRAEETLLGVPDPKPASIERWRAKGDEEMDVMKILELNERLVRQEDSSKLLGAIVEAAIEISGAERGFIVMSKDGALELDTAFDSSRGEIGDEDVEFSRSIVEEALEHRRSLRVSDALEHEEWSAARSVEELRLRSILVAPFFVSPRIAGVVVVDDRTRPGAFGPREQRLLELLGGQAALAMRQVHRLEENRSLAAELRRRVVTQGAQLEQATRALDRAGMASPVEGLIGDSRAMETVGAMIHRVGRADIAALITGPSGSGKEVAARALHSLSPRKDAPFVAENCAALPPSLAESELFGVKKGAFTGAESDREGLFERAGGGTLFLDEIGELPSELQAKLLRVLETRKVRRVGETDERAVDFRLVSATNRDLGVEVEAGRFRADLMYRLDGVTIEMPPLSTRTEDIPALVEHFLALDARAGEAPKTIHADVLRRLMDRPWPGNVRELSNEVSRLSVLSGAAIEDPELVRVPSQGAGEQGAAEVRSTGGRVRTMAELEKMAILDALAATGNDKRKAAELLGISRAKIYQRIKEWGDE